MTLSIQVPHSCQDITRVSEAMSRTEGQPCREQITACVVNPVPPSQGHLEEKVSPISMDIPGDNSILPHSSHGAQVVSHAGKLERHKVP